MIVGSGLIARALAPFQSQLRGTFIHAAGVSNSSCVDMREFERDRRRLEQSLIASEQSDLFVYVSTCSVDDRTAGKTAYVEHKRVLERLIRDRTGDSLIVRLPQVAGKTPNPHTLLNFLHARIARSERFALWIKASRNIIHVADFAQILVDVICTRAWRSNIINIANKHSYTTLEIVREMEMIVGRRAIFDEIDRGTDFVIDISEIDSSLKRCHIDFDSDYLHNTLTKVYGEVSV